MNTIQCTFQNADLDKWSALNSAYKRRFVFLHQANIFIVEIWNYILYIESTQSYQFLEAKLYFPGPNKVLSTGKTTNPLISTLCLAPPPRIGAEIVKKK